METVIELRELASEGWFGELTSSLSTVGGLAPGSLSKLGPPAGTFGASKSKTAKVKAQLETVGQVIAVISASLALYHSASGGTAANCDVTLGDGATTAALVLPCGPEQSPAVAKIVTGALVNLHGLPSSITIQRVNAPPK